MFGRMCCVTWTRCVVTFVGRYQCIYVGPRGGHAPARRLPAHSGRLSCTNRARHLAKLRHVRIVGRFEPYAEHCPSLDIHVPIHDRTAAYFEVPPALNA